MAKYKKKNSLVVRKEEQMPGISSRFTIATLMLVTIALEGKENKVTGDFLASRILRGYSAFVALSPTEKN